MIRQAKDILLLGPYPGNESFSLANYFNFYRRELPSLLGACSLQAVCPGTLDQFDAAKIVRAGRHRAWWDNYVAWPLRLKFQRAELFHIVDQGLAWYARFLNRGKLITTVHDLIAYMSCAGKLPFAPPPRKRQPIVHECVRRLREMDHLLSVSHYTADCLVRELEIPASKITVVHNYLDPEFRPIAAEEERRRIRAKWFGTAEAVVLHVGKPSVYKNRIGALKAFSLVHAELPEARMFLAPLPPNGEESAFLREASCGDAVRFLGPVTKPELREVYGAADVLVFPSLFEGFGWPPLEAMACGCPVVCTRRASLAEVVGDAALTVEDPHDHPRLAAVIREVLTDDRMAADLRRRGLGRAQMFSPATALQAVASVYHRLL